MSEEALWGIIPVGLLLAGFLLLWFAAWRQQQRSSASPFVRRSIALSILGWSGVIVGGIAYFAITALVFAPVVVVIGVVVLLAGAIRYWRSEVRYLVWALAEAADRGIPLERAARAFASEQGGIIAISARTLADYLDAGVPLSVALTRARLGASAEIKMAADLGEKTGTLGEALQRAIARDNSLDDAMGSLAAKFFYLSGLVFVMAAIGSFVMIKIIPTFQQMFEEFGLELPQATQALIMASDGIVRYWYLLFPVFLALMAFVLLALLLYVGVSAQSLPFIRHFAASIDNATLLNLLAVSVRRQQSLADSLLLLSGLCRSARARQRLESAVEAMEQGVHWSDALQYVGVISPAQNAVFRSAERVGNLDWALTEMADAKVRRLAQRAHAALGVLFPGCLIGFGTCALFFAVGMLLPLFSLIGSLT